MRYILDKNPKLNNIKIKRELDVFNKFFKGVNRTKINPIKLLIKKRGYRKIFSQKLFIKTLSY